MTGSNGGPLRWQLRELRWGFSSFWAPSSGFPSPCVLNSLLSWDKTQIHSMFCKDMSLFCCPLPAFSENKEEVQWQMSSCKVIKLTAWGPALRRAGHQRGLESTIGLPGGTCCFSRPSIPNRGCIPTRGCPSVDTVGPQDMSWTMLAQCTKPQLAGCSGHWMLQAFPHVAGEGAWGRALFPQNLWISS